MQRFLAKRELWSEAEDEELRAAIKADLGKALKEADEAGKVPLEWMFDDVFKEMPPHLKAQKAMLEK